jgi:predicted lipoprotein
MSSLRGASPALLKRLVLVAALVVLVLAMVLNTKFLTPSEASALKPAAFSAKTYVQKNFPTMTETLTRKATDVAVLVPAIDKDEAAAGKQYGIDVGSGKFAFPVKASGTVTEVDENFMTLAVPGVPAGKTVRVPLGAAVSGTPLRDATGDMTFSDFSGQTDFQSVANELKVKVRADVIDKADPASLKGKKVTVVGAHSSGGPRTSFIIQPVSIEAS